MEYHIVRPALRLKIIEKFGTQSRFAYQAGIDESLLSKIIRGTRDPNKAQVDMFREHLGDDVDLNRND